MKKKSRKFKNKKSGSMLALAMVIILVLALIGIGLIRLGLNARVQSMKDVTQISARSAADAGIEHAVRYMIDSWNASANKSDWVDNLWYDAAVWTNPAIPATEAGYTSPVIQLGSDTYGKTEFQYTIYKGIREKGYQIVSTGTATSRSTTRTVHAAAVLKSSYIGVGAKEDIYLAPNVQLDTIPADEKIVVQTNGTDDGIITVKPGVTVPGDVVCGPGGNPDDAIDSKGIIEGQQLAAEEEIDFPPILAPSFTSGTFTITTEPNVVTIGTVDSSTSIQLDDMYFGTGGLAGVDTLEISGNVDIFVDGQTYLTPGTKIIVADDSTLDLYLGGNFWAQPGSSIIYGGEVSTEAGIIEAASNISIKGTVDSDGNVLCDEIRFQPDGDFYGTIYAPDASIELWPNGDFYGAVVGGYDVLIKPGGSYYYVPALVNTQDLEVLYMGIKYGSWWEEGN
ncbi:MAG: pilus assembly PilX N-terminal domain-containing protein [Sedimentisphaerales bacterium]|nr:pilus assembly PilX N-terminal domain-containing protein [Sedimentisphaerales bacterium]